MFILIQDKNRNFIVDMFLYNFSEKCVKEYDKKQMYMNIYILKIWTNM